MKEEKRKKLVQAERRDSGGWEKNMTCPIEFNSFEYF